MDHGKIGGRAKPVAQSDVCRKTERIRTVLGPFGFCLLLAGGEPGQVLGMWLKAKMVRDRKDEDTAPALLKQVA
jgi:hypothetical protein